MTIQNYLIIEANVVTNTVVWDGNPDTWQPPNDSIQLIEEITPALIWVNTAANEKPAVAPNWELQEVIGAGAIGFTWDGLVLTTNKPKPETPVAAENQPTISGIKNA